MQRPPSQILIHIGDYQRKRWQTHQLWFAVSHTLTQRLWQTQMRILPASSFLLISQKFKRLRGGHLMDGASSILTTNPLSQQLLWKTKHSRRGEETEFRLDFLILLQKCTLAIKSPLIVRSEHDPNFTEDDKISGTLTFKGPSLWLFIRLWLSFWGV